MRVSTKKGMRYTGGRYEFFIDVLEGSFNEPHLTMAWDSLAHYLTGINFNFSEEGIQKLLQFDSQSGRFEKVYTLKQEDITLARILFSQNNNDKRGFKLEICAQGYLGQNNYNILDKLVENIFGSFERSGDYHPSNRRKSFKPKSQPCHSEQLGLSLPD